MDQSPLPDETKLREAYLASYRNEPRYQFTPLEIACGCVLTTMGTHMKLVDFAEQLCCATFRAEGEAFSTPGDPEFMLQLNGPARWDYDMAVFAARKFMDSRFSSLVFEKREKTV